jgi:hypothetical protein
MLCEWACKEQQSNTLEHTCSTSHGERWSPRAIEREFNQTACCWTRAWEERKVGVDLCPEDFGSELRLLQSLLWNHAVQLWHKDLEGW